MSKNKQIILIVGLVVMVSALGIIIFSILRTDNLDDRTEATQVEDSILELEPTIPEEQFSYDPEPQYPTEENFFSPECKDGDLNCDGEITMADFTLFREDLAYFEENGWADALARSDLNNDRVIDQNDYYIFMDIFEQNF